MASTIFQISGGLSLLLLGGMGLVMLLMPAGFKRWHTGLYARHGTIVNADSAMRSLTAYRVRGGLLVLVVVVIAALWVWQGPLRF